MTHSVHPGFGQIPIRPIRTTATSSAGGLSVPPPLPCQDCPVRHLCPARELLEDNGAAGAGRLMLSQRRLRDGQSLYREGDHFYSVYAVRSGALKTSVSLPDGREQVSGFRLPGDMLGFDGPAQASYASAATALGDAEVCVIPYDQLAAHMRHSQSLQQAVTRIMSGEIVSEQGLMRVLGSMSAQERVAGFLLHLARRMQARGYSGTEFYLRMSREEIGSYLGTKMETVSRALSTFQRRGLIQVNKRHIRILDPGRLSQVQAPEHAFSTW